MQVTNKIIIAILLIFLTQVSFAAKSKFVTLYVTVKVAEFTTWVVNNENNLGSSAILTCAGPGQHNCAALLPYMGANELYGRFDESITPGVLTAAQDGTTYVYPFPQDQVRECRKKALDDKKKSMCELPLFSFSYRDVDSEKPNCICEIDEYAGEITEIQHCAHSCSASMSGNQITINLGR